MDHQLKASEREEPLLKENPDRFCMFPIKYQSIWEMYKKAEASFWTGDPPSPSARTPANPWPGKSCLSRSLLHAHVSLR